MTPISNTAINRILRSSCLVFMIICMHVALLYVLYCFVYCVSLAIFCLSVSYGFVLEINALISKTRPALPVANITVNV